MLFVVRRRDPLFGVDVDVAVRESAKEKNIQSAGLAAAGPRPTKSSKGRAGRGRPTNGPGRVHL